MSLTSNSDYDQLKEYGASSDPKKIENWYLIVNEGRRYEKIFNEDFRCSFRNFFKLWHLGGKDIGPPYCKLLPQIPDRIGIELPTAKSEAEAKADLFKEYYEKKQLRLLQTSHVGCGTDPEQVDVVLNQKESILDRALFPTYAFDDDVNEYCTKIHTFIQENKSFNKTKVGIAFNLDVIPGVSPGLNIVHEITTITKEKTIVGVVDEVYTIAWSKSWLKHEQLHRHLDVDFRKSVIALQELLDRFKEQHGEAEIELPHKMNDFMNKYGTHVVLGCSYGYRKIEKLRTRIKATEEFQNFQSELGLSNDIAKVGVNCESEKKREHKTVFHSDGIYQVGGRYLLKSILSEDYKPKTYSENTRSPDVVSYNETMSIADMLTHSKVEGLMKFAKFYRFWTEVRIQDLSQGWSETPFACSYKLTFRRKNKLRSLSRYSIFVHVIGKQYNTSNCEHQCKDEKWKLESLSQITPVISPNVETIMLTTRSKDIHLSQIGHTCDIFFRKIEKDKGKVVHYEIDLRKIDYWKLELSFKLGESREITAFAMKRNDQSIKEERGILLDNLKKKFLHKYENRNIAWARSVICQ